MAQPLQPNSIDEVLASLYQPGSNSLRQALTILFNAPMLFERQQFLNAEPYERAP
jgi:hypothetical protein